MIMKGWLKLKRVGWKLVANPANKKDLNNIYAMLGQRRRRWADVV